MFLNSALHSCMTHHSLLFYHLPITPLYYHLHLLCTDTFISLAFINSIHSHITSTPLPSLPTPYPLLIYINHSLVSPFMSYPCSLITFPHIYITPHTLLTIFHVPCSFITMNQIVPNTPSTHWVSHSALPQQFIICTQTLLALTHQHSISLCTPSPSPHFIKTYVLFLLLSHPVPLWHTYAH